MMNEKRSPVWAKRILLFAAIYNAVWGTVTVVHPQFFFFGEEQSRFSYMLLQCIGMLVGVYGVGYYIAYLNPVKYWMLILVGLLGKIFGPIGVLIYVGEDVLPREFLVVSLFNDVIWWIPFILIMRWAYKAEQKQETISSRQSQADH